VPLLDGQSIDRPSGARSGQATGVLPDRKVGAAEPSTCSTRSRLARAAPRASIRSSGTRPSCANGSSRSFLYNVFIMISRGLQKCLEIGCPANRPAWPFFRHCPPQHRSAAAAAPPGHARLAARRTSGGVSSTTWSSNSIGMPCTRSPRAPTIEAGGLSPSHDGQAAGSAKQRVGFLRTITYGMGSSRGAAALPSNETHHDGGPSELLPQAKARRTPSW
jgi:hypothetical protein